MDPDSSRHPAPFVAPAEREQIVAQLVESYAHDLLPLEEYERRVTLAYRADSREALRALVADVPAVAARELEPARAAGSVSPVRRFRAFLSNVEHRGALDMPAQLVIRSVLGNVELDLTSARFRPGLTEIDISAVLGNVEIWLPSHVEVENHGEGVLGSFDVRGGLQHTGAATSSTTSVVRLIGRAVLGNVEVHVVGAP